jgi:hypothetical protein
MIGANSDGVLPVWGNPEFKGGLFLGFGSLLEMRLVTLKCQKLPDEF